MSCFLFVAWTTTWAEYLDSRVLTHWDTNCLFSSLLLDRMQLRSAGANGTFSCSRRRHLSQVGRVNKRLSTGREIKQVLNPGGFISHDGIQEEKTQAFHAPLTGIWTSEAGLMFTSVFFYETLTFSAHFPWCSITSVAFILPPPPSTVDLLVS